MRCSPGHRSNPSLPIRNGCLIPFITGRRAKVHRHLSLPDASHLSTYSLRRERLDAKMGLDVAPPHRAWTEPSHAHSVSLAPAWASLGRATPNVHMGFSHPRLPATQHRCGATMILPPPAEQPSVPPFSLAWSPASRSAWCEVGEEEEGVQLGSARM